MGDLINNINYLIKQYKIQRLCASIDYSDYRSKGLDTERAICAGEITILDQIILDLTALASNGGLNG
jgi:hypothetical protein